MFNLNENELFLNRIIVYSSPFLAGALIN
jgi:hypothetical protein